MVLEGLKALARGRYSARAGDRWPKTLAKLREQTPVNTAALDELRGIELPGEVQEQIDEAVHTLRVKSGRSILSNPATVAVGLGFLLLIAILVWNMMGRAGTFRTKR